MWELEVWTFALRSKTPFKRSAKSGGLSIIALIHSFGPPLFNHFLRLELESCLCGFGKSTTNLISS